MLQKLSEAEREIADLRTALVLPAMDDDLLAAEGRARDAKAARREAEHQRDRFETAARHRKSMGEPIAADRDRLAEFEAAALAAGNAEAEAVRARTLLRAEFQTNTRAELFPAIESLHGAVARRLDEIDQLLAISEALNVSATAVGVDFEPGIVGGAKNLSAILKPARHTLAKWR